MIEQNGVIKAFESTEFESLTSNVIQPMAADALRTIGLAYKDFVRENPEENDVLISANEEPDWDNEEILRDGLTLIGIVGIQDPVRPGKFRL